VQFNDDHVFNRALVKFQELTVEVLRQADQLRACTRTASSASRRTISRS
jgi:hypothetical protein